MKIEVSSDDQTDALRAIADLIRRAEHYKKESDKAEHDLKSAMIAKEKEEIRLKDFVGRHWVKEAIPQVLPNKLAFIVFVDDAVFLVSLYPGGDVDYVKMPHIPCPTFNMGLEDGNSGE